MQLYLKLSHLCEHHPCQWEFQNSFKIWLQNIRISLFVIDALFNTESYTLILKPATDFILSTKRFGETHFKNVWKRFSYAIITSFQNFTSFSMLIFVFDFSILFSIFFPIILPATLRGLLLTDIYCAAYCATL